MLEVTLFITVRDFTLLTRHNVNAFFYLVCDDASVSFLFTVKEYCKAVYNYEATNQDELDIKEGEIVHLLSKVSLISDVLKTFA